jgi:osomolarity two-component system sensor histidine kinase SLN1
MHENEGLARMWNTITAFYYRISSGFGRFFFTTFYDDMAEMQYKRETYYQGKGLAVIGSIFVLMNWVRVTYFDPCPIPHRIGFRYWYAHLQGGNQ